MILVRDVDKLVERLSLKYSLKMDGFQAFFQSQFSLRSTSYVITLTQFIEVVLDYLQESLNEKRDGGEQRMRPFHRHTDSMTEVTLKQFLFAQDVDSDEVISLKL